MNDKHVMLYTKAMDFTVIHALIYLPLALCAAILKLRANFVISAGWLL